MTAGSRRARSSRTGRALAALVLACGLLAGAVPLATAAAASDRSGTLAEDAGALDADSTVTLPVPHVWDLLVDDTSGKLVVIGGDAVTILGSGLEVEHTVADIVGARHGAILDGRAYVGTAEDRVVVVDLATGAVVGTVQLGDEPRSLAAVGDAMWVVVGDSPPGYELHRIDPVDLTVSSRGAVLGSEIAAVPGSDDTALLLDLGSFDVDGVQTLDLASDPVTVISGSPSVEEHTPGAAVSPTLLWPFDSDAAHAVADLEPVGWRSPWPLGTDAMWSPARGGTLAFAFGNGVVLVDDEHPRITHSLSTDQSGSLLAVALSPDGARAYGGYSKVGGPSRIHAFDLSTTITSATPDPVERDEVLTVEGRGLGGATAVTVGGIEVTPQVVGPGTLRLRVPPTLPPGTHEVVVTTPWDSATAEVAVAATLGTVSGTVQAGAVPVGGSTVVLDGAALEGPRSMVVGDDGAWAFDGLPAGVYEVVVEHPTHSDLSGFRWPVQLEPGQIEATVRTLLLVPNEPQPPISREVASRGEPEAMVVEPSTGRLFVAAGDSVLVHDREGRLLDVVAEQWGAGSLQIVGDDLYVAQRGAGAVARIDLASLEVEATWPVGRLTNGQMVVAGGRVWVGCDDGLVALDPSTGAVVDADAGADPGLTAIGGDDDRFVLQDDDGDLHLFDARTVPATLVASAPANGYERSWRQLVADADADRLWTGRGGELELSSMTPTGTTYLDARGNVAYTPAHGGVLAVGPRLYRPGSPEGTHDLTDVRSSDRLAFSPDGDQLASRTNAGFAVVDTAATLVAPPIVRPTAGGPTTLRGTGLGGVSTLEVDGTPIPVDVVDTTTITVDLPPLGPGRHQLRALAPTGDGVAQLLLFAPPAPPSGVHVVPGDGRIEVVIDPPTSPELVEHFWVVLDPDEQHVCERVITGCTIDGLDNGTTYQVSVAAENRGGASDFTDPVDVRPRADRVGVTGIEPLRVLDSRTATGTTGGAWGPRESREVAVAGVGGIPADATAVVLNLTAVGPTAATHLTLWPTGSAKPGVSTLNLPAGDVRANAAVVAVGTHGRISIANNAGDTHVIGDITGYLSPDGDEVVAVDPHRLVDSRRDLGTTGGPLGPGQQRTIDVAGEGPVPVGATAAVLTVTAVAPTASTHLTLWPAGTTRPLASNLNVPAGDTRANLVTVALGSGPEAGRVSVRNNSGDTHVVVDVVGYVVAAPDGDVVQMTTPTRAVDSRRPDSPLTGPWGSDHTRTVELAGAAGVPADATAVLVNVTVVGPGAATHLTLWPHGAPRPSTSNVNAPTGDTRAALALVAVGDDGAIDIRNNSGPAHVIVDVVGYTSP